MNLSFSTPTKNIHFKKYDQKLSNHQCLLLKWKKMQHNIFMIGEKNKDCKTKMLW